MDRWSRRRRLLVAALLAGVVAASGAPEGRAEKLTRSAEAAPGRLIVKLRRGVPVGQLAMSARAGRVRWLRPLGRSGLHAFEIPDAHTSVEAACEELAGSPMVEFAEPDYIVGPELVPNDPEFGLQWGLQQTSDADIDAPEAWQVTEGDASIVVAVVDTGVDYTHPDLAGNMWVNPGELLNGIDDDGNGYVDDVHGIDCISGSGDPLDDHGHGTHVAGTIGAVGNNGVGVIGVTPRVSIMALRFIGHSGGLTSDAIECLSYARDMKTSYGVDVRVTSNSWGGGGFSHALGDAIESLRQADILFVASAGNSSSDTDQLDHYPSSYDNENVVSVAATGRTDGLAYFSNYGARSVDLAAPGLDILSTDLGGGYRSRSGTSMAAPHVSGVAALIAAHNPGADVGVIKTLLLERSQRLPTLEGRVASGGRLLAPDVLCSPGDLRMTLGPRDFRVGLGHDTPLRVSLRDCGVPIEGAFVRVTPDNGDPELVLADDGTGADEVANDGIYSASWRAGAPGEVVLDAEAFVTGGTLAASSSGSVLRIPRYVMDDGVPFDWVDATRGRKLRLARDDSDASVSIGFDFPFYGDAFRRVRISSNGYLTFGRSGRAHRNRPLPSSDAPDTVIAPFWDDLDPLSTGVVYTLVEGTAPDRRFTVQWDGFDFVRGQGVVTFQATLHELDGRIVFRYLDARAAATSRDRGASATVGLQDASGDFGIQYSLNEPALDDGLAIEFRVDDTIVPFERQLAAGRTLLVKDVLDAPGRRSLALALADPAIAPPPIGSTSDPSRWGAVLRVRNPVTGEDSTLPLPVAGWKASRSGYRYRARRGDGACSSVMLRRGRLMARCRGAQIGLSLGEPAQGSLGVRLDLGSKTSLCALFGGDVRADAGVGFGRSPRLGSFMARNAAAPASCLP